MPSVEGAAGWEECLPWDVLIEDPDVGVQPAIRLSSFFALKHGLTYANYLARLPYGRAIPRTMRDRSYMGLVKSEVYVTPSQ